MRISDWSSDVCSSDLVARLERRMAGVLHDAQVGLGPGAVQIPRTTQRADHVVAALHDYGGNVADAIDVAQQLVVVREETAVDEVVAQIGRAACRGRGCQYG